MDRPRVAKDRPLRTRFFYSVVLLVFVMSGAAALIYQVAWQRMLTMYYGVGAVSVAVVVAVFMAGLGLGSIAGGWLSERITRRVAWYVGCELAIAFCGALSVPLLARALPQLGGLGYGGGLVVIVVLLLVPTSLMGMTLPIMVKLVNDAVHDVGPNVSRLYFANTVGAAAGALLSSFWLISFHGLDGAIWFAVGVNLLLCVLAWAMLLTWPRSKRDSQEPLAAAPDAGANWVRERWLMFGSGLLAIGYQLIWFRLLSTLLKPNSYVFSSVLSVYLLGLAIGSLWMSRAIRDLRTPERRLRMFYVLNASIALLTLVTIAGFYVATTEPWFASVVRSTFDNELHPPYRRIYEFPGATRGERFASAVTTFDILWWPALLILPTTILMGASYPLVTASAIGSSARDGLRTGLIACIAIAGNVAGAILTGFVLLPMLGTERTLLLFVCTGACWLFGIAQWRGRRVTLWARAVLVGATAAVAWMVMPGPTALYGAMHPPPDGRERIITEAIDGTAVTYRRMVEGREVIQVYIGGSSHATFPSPAYHTEVLEAATYARRLDHVLVIGFGGGDLTDQILRTPGVGRVTVVEISRALTENVRQIPTYARLLNDPRVRFIIEDGRRFLQRTDERFDVLMMDPLQSTAAYSNNLYSVEFFEAARSRLTEDGIAMVWFNEYYTIPKTIATAFPYMKCFYFFCLASPSPMVRDEARRAAVWEGFDPAMRERVQQRLSQPYYDKGGRAEALAAAEMYPINRDLQPVTEYYVGYLIRQARGRF
jgi:spermidine synthase